MFDEFGVPDDVRFPKYYSKGGTYYLNSCAGGEHQILGDFNETCVKNGNCNVNVGQDNVESSLLFSQDRSLFPRVRRNYLHLNFPAKMLCVWAFLHKICFFPSQMLLRDVQKNFAAILFNVWA